MIQRIQTVFLFLVGVCMILFLILPAWELVNPETGEVYKLYSVFMVHLPAGSNTPEYIYYPYSISGGLAVISVVLAFVEIFKYKNRLTQIKIGMINALIMVVSLVLLVVLSYYDQFELMPEVPGKYHPGLFMPAAALVFNSLANRFIRKDEKLVRSVDRIR
jgi:glucan phosphoethanolaminetransferase (alkaline phosphatase superfamily)